METKLQQASTSTAHLVRVISVLQERQPLTDAYERSIDRYLSGGRTVWYRSQKEHMLGWLKEYDGPGAYGRKRPGQDAKFFYNHLRCAAGLMWLAEALEVDPDELEVAITAVRDAGANTSSQCAGFRRVIPWERVDELVPRTAARAKRSRRGAW